MTLEAASGFLHDLVAELDDVVALGSSALTIGATCGLARMEQPGTGEEIMRRADLALYRGKDKSCGGVVCWDAQIEAKQTERQRAIARLRAALNGGRAVAAYQPIVELATGRITSFEALLRLKDEDGSLITASEIFSALLDPELSRRVSRAMLDQVAADGPAILALLEPDTRIGLNLSEADLRKYDFVRHLIDVVDDSALTPANFIIEVTETMLLDAGGQLHASLALLDACGFTICLDDFGTGFSSLTHLRQFPIHKVKIDRDLIAGIGEDHHSRLIIQAIVQMGQSLGLRVVAEGGRDRGTGDLPARHRLLPCAGLSLWPPGSDRGSVRGSGQRTAAPPRLSKRPDQLASSVSCAGVPAVKISVVRPAPLPIFTRFSCCAQTSVRICELTRIGVPGRAAGSS